MELCRNGSVLAIWLTFFMVGAVIGSKAISSTGSTLTSNVRFISSPPLDLPSSKDSIERDKISSSPIDTSFYSRQLFVYGKSAQQRLVNAKVAIVNSCEIISHEVVKNLALAGVGEITIINSPVSDRHKNHCYNILGQSTSLQEYAHNLNPHIKVNYIADISDSHAIDTTLSLSSVVVICAKKLADIYAWNARTRELNVKASTAMVTGTVGLVFNDFLDTFLIEDVEGETQKEIFLLPSESKLVLANDKNKEGNIIVKQLLRIQSIDDENLNFGIGDTVALTIQHGQGSSSCLFEVEKVLSTKSCLLSIKQCDKSLTQFVSTLQSSPHATLLKQKQEKLIHHHPFVHQMQHPSFAVCNGCLSSKQNHALNLVLFAMLQTLEAFHDGLLNDDDNSHSSSSTNTNYEALCKTMLLEELKWRGVKNPLLSLKQGGKIGTEWIDYVFSRYFNSFTSPCPATTSVVGSIVAQEVIKAITHMYQPISQLYFFESLDSLHENHNKSSTFSNKKLVKRGNTNVENHVGQIYGQEIQQELQSLKVFVVGAGAIGCELLKNFALLGVGATSTNMAEHNNMKEVGEMSVWRQFGLEKGGILITDMDLIEKSNLNRQLLFRDKHIGQPKSLVAAEQVRHINPHLQVHGITQKVSPDTLSPDSKTNVFPDAFWRETDIVIMALDNVEARKLVDAQCVKHKCILIDSGTLGTKANVQVVLPFLTESYASAAGDPPEENIPLCTLKSFPYQPEHTVAWAKALFEEYFQQDLHTWQSFLSIFQSLAKKNDDSSHLFENVFNDKKIQNWQKSLSVEDILRWNETVQLWKSFIAGANSLCENTTDRKPSLLDEKVINANKVWKILFNWAEKIFHRLFFHDIEVLLRAHPENSVDEDGLPFWSGSRKRPVPIVFDPANNQLHRDFIASMVFLRIQSFGWSATLNIHSLSDVTEKLQKNFLFVSTDISNVTHGDSTSDTNGCVWGEMNGNMSNIMEDENNVSLISLGLLWQQPLQPQTYEKDNLLLGHVACVAASSNLRSINYGIPLLDVLEVQRVSGKIIPALATTTSLIAGMVSLEVMKVASERVYARQCRDTTRAIDHQQNESVVNVNENLKETKAIILEEDSKIEHNTDDNKEEIEVTVKTGVMRRGRFFIRQMTDSLFRPIRKPREFLFKIMQDYFAMEKNDDVDINVQESLDISVDDCDHELENQETESPSFAKKAIWAREPTSPAARHYQRTRNHWLFGFNENSNYHDKNINFGKHHQRLLKRFRNTYANLAIPILSFTQLVAANPSDEDQSFIYNLQDLENEENNHHVYFLPANERVVPSISEQLQDIVHQKGPNYSMKGKDFPDSKSEKHGAFAKRVSLWEEIHVPKLLRYGEEITVLLDETLTSSQEKKNMAALEKKLFLSLKDLLKEEEQDADDIDIREVTLSDVFSYLKYRFPAIQEIVAVTEESHPDYMLYANFLPNLKNNLFVTLPHLFRDKNVHDHVEEKQEQEEEEEVNAQATARLMITVSVLNEEHESFEMTLPPVIVNYSPSLRLDSLEHENEFVVEEMLLEKEETREMDHLLKKLSQNELSVDEIGENDYDDNDDEVFVGDEANDIGNGGDLGGLLMEYDEQPNDKEDAFEKEIDENEDNYVVNEDQTDDSEKTTCLKSYGKDKATEKRLSWKDHVKEMVKLVLFDEDYDDGHDDDNSVEE